MVSTQVMRKRANRRLFNSGLTYAAIAALLLVGSACSKQSETEAPPEPPQARGLEVGARPPVEFVSPAVTGGIASPPPPGGRMRAARPAEGTLGNIPIDSGPLKPFQPPLTEEELRDGWISLFDGRSLFGWKAATEANWAVADGTITVYEGTPGLLCTTIPFGDYILDMEFRFAPGTNSGVFLHTPALPKDPQKDCYELNIAEPTVSPFPTGSFVGRQKSTDDAGKAEPDEWHRFEVTLDGDHVVVQLDGQQCLDYTDPMPLRRGLIGLQLNKGAVAFRNLKLKPLNLKPLLNGKDLTGWKQYPEMPGKFTMTEEGELHVQGGRGQLESADSYGDFVVRLECKTNAENLNSGLFFRCIPGQEMNGYESQIHNGIQNRNRAQPVDCGTGGIFRRQNARLVAADDLTWFTKTIVAAGPHVSVWVNGFQVTDWTDTRAADENPRKGLRTAPGTFMLQAHDPTTDILFRNLYASEIARP